MSLRFYFGSSGAGKSTKVYEEIIRRSMEEEKRQFLIIVPDQFTMQTQKELVRLHERGGIMNIDVLSFGRLAHRILEEVGGGGIPVLDDTGKSLVLRKVAAVQKEKLQILGGHLDKQGYIHEVKSAISEFMQYGIGSKELDKLIQFSDSRRALSYKLADLKLLYESFLTYIRDQFITTEETMDILQESLHKSKIVKNSVVVFDGFTGFTPIQYRVMGELMHFAKEVIVTITIGSEENPFQMDGEQKLFYLSKKTVGSLTALAQKEGIERGADVTIKGDMENSRFGNNPCLAHLEKQLFRYPIKPFEKETRECLTLFEASDPKEEIRQTALKILELIRKKGYCYRDIAVITGNMDSYAAHIEAVFEETEIPFFLDRTRGIVCNPFVEYIRSVFEMLMKDFSYESVFRYLRSGMTDFSIEEVDELENYVIAAGIRGKSKWSKGFSRRIQGMGEDLEPLEGLNRMRETMMTQLQPVLSAKPKTAGDYVEALYDFLTANEAEQKLHAFEQVFQEQNEPAKAKEYGQIYRLVMDLLNQIYTLIGGEAMTAQEFLDILNAGFGEIEVGTIPQNVDRVLIGDMERTRLKEIKALFFVGVNDGNIPKNNSKGGIISDMDREFLNQSDWELAPTPRQQMFIQRFYLYLNMTKPKERLYLSYAKVMNDGKASRPSYLIDTLKSLYPGLFVEVPQNLPVQEQILLKAQGMTYLAELFREFAEGFLDKEQEKIFYSIYTAYRREETDGKELKQLEDAAFFRYLNIHISRVAARAVYGKILENSVSRLETFAACAYAHFLQYGLSLKEREEFGFESVDMGNVFHECLQRFSEGLKDSPYTWFTFPPEYGTERISSLMDTVAAEYGSTVLYSDERSMYAVTRMKRILSRTVSTLQNQLLQGSFTPTDYELNFRQVMDLEEVNIALSKEEQMRLRGRIDRVDTWEENDRIYVKIVDYKSGGRQFDLVALYYGLQLQLVVYMNAAMQNLKQKHPEKEVVPAALLYYHVEDPAVEMDAPMTPEEINEKLLLELRMNGVVNGDARVIEGLDRTFVEKSTVIPVEKKKDGSLGARSSCMSTEELSSLFAYTNQKIKRTGRQILDGEIAVNPYEKGGKNACTYCSFQGVCGFDNRLPGYQKRELASMTREAVWEKIREEIPEQTD